MDNIIKKNKFSVVLLTVTIAVSLFLAFLIWSNGSKFDKLAGDLKTKQTNISSLKSVKNQPEEYVKEKLMERIKAYQLESENLQNKLIKRYHVNLQSLTPVRFSEKLRKYKEVVEAGFKGRSVSYDSTSWFGFDEYSSKSIQESATGIAGYQLDAFEWMFAELASVEPENIVGVRRARFPEESPGFTKQPATPKKGSKKVKGRKVGLKILPLKRYRVDVSFVADVESFYEFLEKLTNSDTYFFEIDSVRVVNTKSKPVRLGDIQVKAPVEALGTLDFDEDTVEEEEDREILIRVNGDEQIKVDLALSLVIFEDPKNVQIKE